MVRLFQADVNIGSLTYSSPFGSTTAFTYISYGANQVTIYQHNTNTLIYSGTVTLLVGGVYTLLTTGVPGGTGSNGFAVSLVLFNQ